ncbi:4'-phosphopantetheinyl transferase family protein [Desulfonatronum parangueonense]
MPANFAAANSRFLRESDRRERILARLLVLVGLSRLGVAPSDGLSSWGVDVLGRPALGGADAGWDFNISHTEGLAAAVFSLAGRVGIDVERRGPGDSVEEYLDAFTAAERPWILAGANPKKRMLRLWTRKEAVLKAAGTGFSLNPATLDVLDGDVVVGRVQYTTRELGLGVDYHCHIAAAFEPTGVEQWRLGPAELLMEAHKWLSRARQSRRWIDNKTAETDR